MDYIEDEEFEEYDDEELDEEYDDEDVVNGYEKEFTTDVEGNLETLRDISTRIKELTDKIISYEKKGIFYGKIKEVLIYKYQKLLEEEYKIYACLDADEVEELINYIGHNDFEEFMFDYFEVVCIFETKIVDQRIFRKLANISLTKEFNYYIDAMRDGSFDKLDMITYNHCKNEMLSNYICDDVEIIYLKILDLLINKDENKIIHNRVNEMKYYLLYVSDYIEKIYVNNQMSFEENTCLSSKFCQNLFNIPDSQYNKTVGDFMELLLKNSFSSHVSIPSWSKDNDGKSLKRDSRYCSFVSLLLIYSGLAFLEINGLNSDEMYRNVFNDILKTLKLCDIEHYKLIEDMLNEYKEYSGDFYTVTLKKKSR